VTTFDARLLGDRKSLVHFVAIDGIARVFRERPVDTSLVLGAGRPESDGLFDISEGGEDLDYNAMSVIGGSLSFSVTQKSDTSVLVDIFRPRARRQTWLTADISSIATALTVESTAGLANGQDIYLGDETITIGTVATGTSLTGCTRARYGSRAQAHKSSSTLLGASVYTVPPAWVGRRVRLYAAMVDASGGTTAARTKLLGVYPIESNPVWETRRTLAIRCGPLIDELLSAPLYQGFDDVGGGRVLSYETDPDNKIIEVEDAAQFAPGLIQTYALAKLRGGYGLLSRVMAIDTILTPQTVRVAGQDMLDPPGGVLGGVTTNVSAGFARFDDAEKVRHVAVVSGMTGTWPLWLLHSRLGDAANGPYDKLPGTERAVLEGKDRRMGAGIHQDDVDQNSFTSLTGRWAVFPLMAAIDARAVLREACLALEAFVYVSDGKLRLGRLGDSGTAPTLTLGASTRVARVLPTSWVDEDSIYPRVKWSANYDPALDDFLLEHVTVDGDLIQRYTKREKTKSIETRALGVDTDGLLAPTAQRFARPFPMSLAELDQTARAFQVRGGRGRLMIEALFTIGASVARIGDVVTLDFDANDCDGGTVRGRNARVVGRHPDRRSGTCRLTFDVFDPTFRIAPSCTIVARSTVTLANDTLELSTTAPDAAGASPQDDFHDGQTVRIWDVSAGTSAVATIAARLSAPPRLRFTAAAPAIEANRDWLTWDTLGTSAGTTPNGDDESDWVYFVPNNSVMAEGPIRRWS
jgi:hypothetical protein